MFSSTFRSMHGYYAYIDGLPVNLVRPTSIVAQTFDHALDVDCSSIRIWFSCSLPNGEGMVKLYVPINVSVTDRHQELRAPRVLQHAVQRDPRDD